MPTHCGMMSVSREYPLQAVDRTQMIPTGEHGESWRRDHSSCVGAAAPHDRMAGFGEPGYRARAMTRYVFGITTCLLASLSTASAQNANTSSAIFLEAVRDPGRPDRAPTGRSLALGGLRSTSGQADDAVTDPGRIMLASGTDLVVSLGPFFYSRDELVTSPAQFPPTDPSRQRSPASRTTPFYAAFAARRGIWAAAGFYDNTTRFAHAFETAQSTVFFTALQGTFVQEDALARASVQQRVSRTGGSVALGDPAHRFGVGISLYAVRFDYAVSTHVHFDTSGRFAGGPIGHSTAEQDNAVTFLDWGTGFTISAAVRPTRSVTLGGRWQREPGFTSTRRFVTETQLETTRTEDTVELQLPPTYSFGVTVTGDRTTVAGEYSRTNYSDAFQPILGTGKFGECNNPELRCPGWNIANYLPANAGTWRAGIEHRIPVSAGTFILRAGGAFEEGYTAARPTDDSSNPLRNGSRLPAPPVVGEYEPPRERSVWMTGGFAYAWRLYEIGVGAGRSDTELRLLADIRVRLP